jgi:hypothetical protein
VVARAKAMLRIMGFSWLCPDVFLSSCMLVAHARYPVHTPRCHKSHYHIENM